MYVDIMSPDAYLILTKKILKTFGPSIAVYWAVLMSVCKKVVKKKEEETLANNGFFTLDRNYVESETTIPIEEQLAFDKTLEKFNLVKQDANDPNRICISQQAMLALVIEDDPKALTEIRKKAKVKREDAKLAKQYVILKNLQAGLVETDKDLLEALKLWIQSCQENKTFMNKTVIQIFQNSLNSFTDNKQVKLKLIEIATIHGWSDFAWARNSYEKDYKKPSGTFIGSEQKQSTGIDTSTKF